MKEGVWWVHVWKWHLMQELLCFIAFYNTTLTLLYSLGLQGGRRLYLLAPSKSITAIGLFSKMLQRAYGLEVSGWPCVIVLAGSDAVVLAGCDGGSDLSSLSLSSPISLSESFTPMSSRRTNALSPCCRFPYVLVVTMVNSSNTFHYLWLQCNLFFAGFWIPCLTTWQSHSNYVTCVTLSGANSYLNSIRL